MFPVLAGSNPSGYNLTRSLRFRSSASAYLNRTPASAGNQTTWTWSGWVKRGTLSTSQTFFSAYNGSTNNDGIGFNPNDTLYVYLVNYGAQVRVSNAVFRDPSAWYHIVFVLDTSNATAQNRIRVWVNGSEITAWSTNTTITQNQTQLVNTVNQHNISRYNAGGYFDGYLAEVNFIDGQALTPSSFGSTNALTGVWQPAAYTGTYGTNGFYLKFTDNSTAAALGTDFSGNSNTWTTNNISITSGVTYDSMTDVPTLTSATAANFAVLNPLVTGATLTNGNLTASSPVLQSGACATISLPSGKTYYECIPSANPTTFHIGIIAENPTVSQLATTANANSVLYRGDGGIFRNTGSGFTQVQTVASYTNGDVIACAVDMTGLTIQFYKNNTAVGTAVSLTSGVNYTPWVTFGTTSTAGSINFGQQPFAYTPPTGFVALNTFNLPTSTIVKGNTVMDATLYTGNGSTQTITNAAGFRPDLVWDKRRDAAGNHGLFDSVRGGGNWISSNATNAETAGVNGVTAFNSNGFSVGSHPDYNTNAATQVAWQWQAGQGTTSSNTSGSITSTVSVNASAGFSVVTWTGASGTNTIGHGLGVAPSWIVTKSRSAIGGWPVYHVSIGGTGAVQLESSGATNTNIGYWNNTAPTSSVFTTSVTSFPSGTTFVAYCFAQIPGFSSFGSYTGNGSTDGPFIYTGFRPKYFLIKCTSTGGAGYDWYVLDSVRNPYNYVINYLFPNYANAEDSSGGPNYSFDFVSNGIKIRGNGNGQNQNGQTFAYIAFAENPFKNALAR
jgi:hypothetical protein